MSSKDSLELSCNICGSKLDPTILGGACSACMWSDIISGEETERATVEDSPIIPGYSITKELGYGGMGIVYQATQETPSREVALKIVAPYSLRASQAKERFMVEIDAMAAIEHPNLLPLYDTGEDITGRPWLTMKLAQGGTLSERIPNYQGDWRASAMLLVTLCEAVHYAHERGVLHRDLKPANVLFDDENNPYISDFGLAKWADNDQVNLTLTTHLLGSPAYLAPEAASAGSKLSTTVSDVYGLGAILYETLVGQQPYNSKQSSQTQILTQVLQNAPASPRKLVADIPRDLEVVTLKAMAREPEKRYQSATDLAADLQRWLDGRPITARPITPAERLWNWSKRNPAVATLSILFIASLITGGILLWNANRKLTTALNDAEDRVDFMTRELPVILDPVGRLDLLDRVFQNVSEHYENNTRADPQTLARHADFLTNWSGILLPRGQVHAAVDRLETAMTKARAATTGSHFPIEAARARISTGNQLGQALTKAGKFQRAEMILEETQDFANSQKTSDLRLQVLAIQNDLAFAALFIADKKYKDTLSYGKRALDRWQPLIPLLEETPSSPHHQNALVEIANTYLISGSALSHLKRHKEQNEIMTEGLRFVENLLKISPENTLYRHELTRFRLYYIRKSPQSDKEKLLLLKLANEDIELLTNNDRSNIEWATTSVVIAVKISDACWRLKDYDGYIHWLRIAGERLSPLYQTHSTDIDMIQTHRHWADYIAERLKNDSDWALGKKHFEAAIRLQIQLCKYHPDPYHRHSLDKGLLNISRIVEEQEGRQSAELWKKKFQQEIEKEL